MTITFYNVKSEKNRIDKTSSLGAGTQYTGSIRDTSCSIEHPIITIKSDTYPDYSYAYITDFDRYYFVVAKSVLVTGLYSFELDEDVLMTFKGNRNAPRTGIFALSGYCSRYEFGNGTGNILTDHAYPITAESTITKYSPVGLTQGEFQWQDSSKFLVDKVTTERQYMVLYQGSGVNNGSVLDSEFPMGAVAFDLNNFHGFIGIVSQTNFGSVLSFAKFSDFVYKASWYPFPVCVTGSSLVTKLRTPGFLTQDLDISALTANNPNVCRKTFTWEVTVSAPGSSFDLYRNFPPYTNLTLRFLPFGVFVLDGSYVFSGHSATVDITVQVNVDVLTGQAALFYGIGGTAPIYLGSGNVSVQIPYTTASYNNILSGYLSAGQGLLSGAASIATGNVGGILPALSEIGAGVSSMVTPTTESKPGTFNHIDSVPTVIVQTRTVSGEMPSEFGRPYGKSVVVGTLGGFAKFDRIEAYGTGLENATANELDRIVNAMKEGVFI